MRQVCTWYWNWYKPGVTSGDSPTDIETSLVLLPQLIPVWEGVLATSVDTGVDARCRPIYQTNIGISLLYLSAFYQPAKFCHKVNSKLKMKWLLNVSIAKNENKNKIKNHLISVVGFQHVNIIIEAWLKYCSLYLDYSQIWLNLPQDDHHLGYILKNSKNNIGTDWEWYSLTTLISYTAKGNTEIFNVLFYHSALVTNPDCFCCWNIMCSMGVCTTCSEQTTETL
jgi:hypothetical protein